MNDYGELLKLPYKKEDISEPLKKLIKYDKIKPFILETEDKENNTFYLVGRKFITKLKVSIRIKELEKGYTEVEIIAKSNHIDFGNCEKTVRTIVNIIFKELENCEYAKNDKDFSIEILQIKNKTKKIRSIVGLIVLFYMLYRFIFSLTMDDYYVTMYIKDFWHYPRLQFIWSIISTFIFIMLSNFRYKRYSRKRIIKIKSKLYNLLEHKNIKKNEADNKPKELRKGIDALIMKGKPYINKGIDFIKRTKKEKPKVFWTVSISLGILLTWGIIGSFSPTHIEGEYVQQLNNYTGSLGGHGAFTFTFKDGTVHGSGIGKGDYENPTYEYKIKGKKIYVIINGQEVFSELTIRNKNTLIYGDGVVDEDCSANNYHYLGDPYLECVPNSDGVYKKQ